MYHAQQLIHSIDQIASQLRQQEANNRQIISQIEQKEALAAQNLQRIQQMCQECSQIMQGTSMPTQSNYGQSFQGIAYQPGYSSGISGTPGMTGNLGTTGMSGFTGMSGISSGSYRNDGVRLGQPQNYGHIPQTQSPLVDSTTMGASTYHDSLQQFGSPINTAISSPGFSSQYNTPINPQLSIPSMGASQIGNQTVSYPGQYTSGMNMEISSLPTNEPFASTANMSPSKYQSAAKKLGSSGANSPQL